MARRDPPETRAPVLFLCTAMPSLVVVSRSLRRSGGEEKCTREKRSNVQLPPSGDPVAALIAALAAPKGSRVQLAVRRTRLLRGEEVLDSFTQGLCWAYASRPARSAAAGVAATPVRTLCLVAVPRGERCVTAQHGTLDRVALSGLSRAGLTLWRCPSTRIRSSRSSRSAWTWGAA
jgi:hypothetical protein